MQVRRERERERERERVILGGRCRREGEKFVYDSEDTTMKSYSWFQEEED